MKTLAFCVALAIMAVGAVGILFPPGLLWIARQSLSSNAFYLIAGARIGFGAILISVAAASRTPKALLVLGSLILIAGIATALTGLFGIDRASAIIDWWTQQGFGIVRLTAAVVMGLGGFVAYACAPGASRTTLHELLDFNYGEDGDAVLRRMLDAGADLNTRAAPHSETPLHVATRRRRTSAIVILLGRGADIDATTAGGKTAYAHAVRRKFDDVADVLRAHGASTVLNEPDRLAVAIVNGRLDEARTILASLPGAARTGNPEEDRLLADVAGRDDTGPVETLIGAGASLTAPGLDDGTPLHQAAWFGQPNNARLLIDAGAPLEIFDAVHESSPLGWAVHGSRYSGGAEERQDAYVALVRMLLAAGSSFQHPGDPQGDRYRRRLLQDASPQVREILERGISG